MARRSRLQFLFDIAQATFSQPTPPTARQIEALRKTLSQVPLEELGLPPHLHGDSSSSSRSSSPGLSDGSHPLLGTSCMLMDAEATSPRPPITYLLIYEDARVSLGIFCLPARAKIPLHNHPGMTVLSRVLYGEMHINSYDWFNPDEAEDECPLPREARVVLDTTLSASDPPAVLFPYAGGNIHEFTALTDCAVLDLMSPPYSTEDGRDCTYYAVVPNGHSTVGDVVLLDSREPPLDFVINQGHYVGMQPRPKLQLPGAPPGSPLPLPAGEQISPTASCDEEGVVLCSPPLPAPVPQAVSPTLSSPTSVATGVAQLTSLLDGAKVVSPSNGSSASCGGRGSHAHGSAGWPEAY